MSIQATPTKLMKSFMSDGYWCYQSVTTCEAVFALLQNEDAVKEAADVESYTFASTEEGLVFYQKNRHAIIAMNAKKADIYSGMTLAQFILHKNCAVGSVEEAQLLIDGAPNADQIERGIDVSVYNSLGANLVSSVCSRYQDYSKETVAIEEVDKWLDYRECQDLEDLINHDDASAVIAVIGGEEVFLQTCERDSDYSMVADGIHNSFSSFNQEHYGSLTFLKKEGFKYYQPSAVDTVFDGMKVSEFDGYLPTREEVTKYLMHDVDKVYTSKAGVSIVVWIIEQMASQLKSEYKAYAIADAT